MNRNDAERERGDANESDVDRWLDDALAVYAKAEPRAGPKDVNWIQLKENTRSSSAWIWRSASMVRLSPAVG